MKELIAIAAIIAVGFGACQRANPTKVANIATIINASNGAYKFEGHVVAENGGSVIFSDASGKQLEAYGEVETCERGSGRLCEGVVFVNKQGAQFTLKRFQPKAEQTQDGVLGAIRVHKNKVHGQITAADGTQQWLPFNSKGIGN